MKRSYLPAMIILALCGSGAAVAQSADQGATQKAAPRASVSSTSNTTSSNDTRRAQQLQGMSVSADTLNRGGGYMTVQDAPKAVSTVTREAIQQGAPGATFVQAIESIPGVNAATDDVTGLNDGSYSIRGYTSDEIGATVNGAPINDSGNYRVYSSEYGDTENMGDITVTQGYPDSSMPVMGAAGGSIAWVTIDPSHKAGVDATQSFGSNSYHRTFVRLNTGDTGPVRSWLSYSNNEANFWRGQGHMKISKADAKSVWTIDDRNSISASIQYNREFKNSYYGLGKADAARDYFQSYSSNPHTATGAINTSYWKLHTNPFKSYLASLDGEFTLSDSLHLSVVPYFQYGSGGGGSTTTFTESANPADQYRFKYLDQDLNGDGVVGCTRSGCAPVYALSYSYTYRPGVVVKFNQDLTDNNSLEYGVWYEKPRQQQGQAYSPIDPSSSVPADNWGSDYVIRYPNGGTQKSYDQYTTTDTRKGFVTDTWTPTDKWTFTASLAYLWVKRSGYIIEAPSSIGQYGSQVSATYHKVTPTVGVKFQLDEKNQFYFGGGKTFRAPINGSLNTSILGAGNQSATKPESAITADLGWRFYGERLSANVDVYGSNFNNKQVSGYDQATGLTVYQAVPKVHMRGVSLEGAYQISDDWKVYANYNYVQARLQTNLEVAGEGTQIVNGKKVTVPGIYNTRGKTLFNTPRNLGFVSVQYNHGPLWASLNAKYRGPVWGDWSNTEKVGGYTTLNLNTGWKFHDFGALTKPYVKFNVSNLLNRKAFTFVGSTGTFLSPEGGATYDSNGSQLYAASPYYQVLQDRTYMVTFGASFF
ncbi:TonB-dependent receptor [Frateuria defendens]|uniref:TonB-dependent receptor n=1 Tax=Frateuria defendens TaxID=2219559 RepID=UPI00066FB33B|nr:TonB-dependent receptor [Frateuria defendens]